MKFREYTEQLEQNLLSKYATLSVNSKGRDRYEENDKIRTCFMRDRDRIIHSKSFRRLKHKTQVFLSPEGDHYRTRLTHTLEVAQIARTISRALRLNEDLTEAIALGHDLGHTPFGHAGERAIREVYSGGFDHNLQSVRVAQKLEKNGRGLNLTKEVIDGIANHTWSGKPSTLEGMVVRYADVIAYINHDIDDAIRGGVLTTKQIPTEFLKLLGATHSERIATLIMAVVDNSFGKDYVLMDNEIEYVMLSLKEFMFENVYFGSIAKAQEDKAIGMLKTIFTYYEENIGEIPEEFLEIQLREGVSRAIIDYISGMSDRYAVALFEKLFIPNNWQK